jgi:N-acetyl-gamma-glutamyl-phosphate reductase
MISAGIIGGTGYTAGELIRILLWHPEVEITFIHSGNYAGQAVASVHTDLVGEINLNFVETWEDQVDVLFLCLPHGASAPYLANQQISASTKIIDLSRDFRLKANGNDFIYGLPELHKSSIQNHGKIANCGCFATTIQLGLLPLAKAHLLKDDIHIHAITGSTGAGKSPGSTSHFSWRNNNVSVYKAFRHQHLGEIKQSLEFLQPGFDKAINFIPVRGNFTRGIFASMYTKVDQPLNETKRLYEAFYADAPFVFVTEDNPDLKQVINTNKCLIYLEQHDDQLLIISTLDNLLKGASGQAVQNMNLLFGFPETSGLHLKAVAF